jgi:hypothetical protein
MPLGHIDEEFALINLIRRAKVNGRCAGIELTFIFVEVDFWRPRIRRWP